MSKQIKETFLRATEYCAAFPIILLAAMSSAPALAKQPTNFVFILVDDLGYMDVGCNNPKTNRRAWPFSDRGKAKKRMPHQRSAWRHPVASSAFCRGSIGHDQEA